MMYVQLNKNYFYNRLRQRRTSLLSILTTCLLLIGYSLTINDQHIYAQEDVRVDLECLAGNYRSVKRCNGEIRFTRVSTDKEIVLPVGSDATDEKANAEILVINPKTLNICFETVLPRGIIGGEEGQGLQECTDVNIPLRSSGPGCYVAGNPMIYPRETVGTMAEHERDKDIYEDIIAVFNTDYFNNETYLWGAQGLAVKNGDRLDRLADNKVNWPSLSIAKNGDVRIGSAKDDISQIYSHGLRDWNPEYQSIYWNTAGGLPVLLDKDGKPDTDELNCTACPYPKTPRGRTAVGKRADGQLVVLVIEDKVKLNDEGSCISNCETGVDLQELAYIMVALGAKQALNLDGGGSSQLWYDDHYIVGSKNSRPVAEGLMIYKDKTIPCGSDIFRIISLPVSPLVEPGTETMISLTIQNISNETWKAGDYALVNVDRQELSRKSIIALDEDVPSGTPFTWELPLTAPPIPGVYSTVWVFSYKGERYGPLIMADLVVVPVGSSVGFRGAIQGLIERINQLWETQVEQAKEDWEKTKAQIEERIRAEIERQLREAMREICPCLATVIGPIMLGAVWWGRRHTTRNEDRDDYT